MTATATVAGPLDAYHVQPRRYPQWPGIEHLAISRHDHQPIDSSADVCAVKEQHVPGGLVHALDLWVMPPAAPSPDDVGSPADLSAAGLPSPAAAAAAAAARTPSVTPTPARRRARAPRHAATLNLARREVSLLDELAEQITAATEHGERLRAMFDPPLTADRAELLAGVKDKLERLPHDQVVVDEPEEADW
jgi:hypothetical protein